MTLVYSHGKILVALDGKVVEDITERLSLRDSPFVGKGTPSLRVSYWCHKISKSTSLDCNKIYVVMV